MRTVENIKIGISGVRGIVGETLNPEIVLNFTRAFATLIGSGHVAVAKDSRFSGDYIKRAVFSSLIFSGITPVNTFTIPTPTLQIYVRARRLDGGVIITASHNPEQWNGLKFVNREGLFLSSYTASHLLDIYHQRGFITPAKNSFPDIVNEEDAFAIHQKKILKMIDLEAIKACQFRVLVDPGGGACSRFDQPFLKALGCRVTTINDRIETYFPRKPECLPENLVKASDTIKQGEFDIGFAQDSDGDRLVILDEKGRPISGDYGLAIALDGYLKGRRGGKIVVNLSTSDVVEFVAKKHGFSVEKSAVGEINVVEKMKEIGAIAGGEGNGGVIIPEIHHCRDSFTAMALTLESLAKSNKKISEIIGTYPDYKIIKDKMPFSMTGANRIVSLLKEKFPDGNQLDGLRVDRPDHWFHVRASNTEPILRIIAEGKPGQIETIMEELQDIISSCAGG